MAAPGRFVTLSEGRTHYLTAGPDTGPAVVLVHGFSTPLFVWERTIPALVAAGRRVVAYDLFGRGFSDRPRGAYGPARYQRQLAELIAALGLEAPVDLVGFSMGAQIAAQFADAHPSRVRRLVLVDPAGFGASTQRPSRLALLPGIGELLQRRAGVAGSVERTMAMFVDPAAPAPDFRDRVAAQTSIPGTLRALLSTRRAMPASAVETYARIGRQGRPVLLVWGREDRVTPFANHEIARRALPGAEFLAVEGAGHAAHYEGAGVVNPVMTRFLD